MVITVTTTPSPARRSLLAQVQRRERDQLVAVDHGAGAIDREHAVAVAVEGQAERMPARAHLLAERGDMGRATALVDVAPVGACRHDGDVCAKAAEDLRGNLVGGAVGAVEQDVKPVETQLGEARLQLAQIVLVRAAQLAHPPDAPGACRHCSPREPAWLTSASIVMLLARR